MEISLKVNSQQLFITNFIMCKPWINQEFQGGKKMISQEMVKLGTSSSVIRELAKYGAERAKVVGKENVLDFSLGNPSIPAPQEVKDTIIDIVQNWDPIVYHSYSPAPGHEGCRSAIADSLNKKHGTNYTKDNLFLTCGAASALSISLKALISDPSDEIIILAPFFPEYKVYISSQGGKIVLVEAKDDMQLNLEGIEAKLNKNTKAIMVNNPNNPSGVIYSREEIEALASLLESKQKEYGRSIYIISDEPYRELVIMDGAEVAFVPNIYKNTLVCYSYSKSLSMPGERIGYIMIPSDVDDKQLMAGCAGAARALGYVCAPTLMQFVIERCANVEPDISVYKENRDLLYDGLTKLGYKLAKPAGAFYLFIEAPNGSGIAFSEKAKEVDLLLVPGSGFGADGYVRLSYCVERETCEKALPVFEKLMKEYK